MSDYKIYIEAFNNFPINREGVSALVGFRARQADIIFFEEIEEVPVRKSNIVVGCIETTNKYFEKLGLPPKMALNIPEDIQSYAGRNLCTMTMGELKRNYSIRTTEGSNCFPFFIKGNGRAKTFVPGIIRDMKQVHLYFHDVPDDEPILCSEIMNFVSEWRVYICKGEVLGINHYLGDMWKFVDHDVVLHAIASYKSAPAGYCMDFGVNDTGHTYIVECNDGWSLGNYGLDDSKYVKLLCARWLELMKEI